MTDREAIEVLRLDCDLITFDPMTGEIIDLETVKLRNDLNYKCYLANKVAISALQEREERSKGCEFCNIEANKNAMIEDHGYAVCPYCGRPLKGDET